MFFLYYLGLDKFYNPYISARSPTPNVNHIINKNKMILTEKGIEKPNLFFRIALVRGKKNNDNTM